MTINLGKTAAVIYHRHAGQGKAKRTASAVKTHLEKNGWRVHGPIMTRYAGHAENVLAGEWAPKVDLLVVVGGDGTLREVCAGLMNHARNVVLGFIPMGNANVVARELKIPLDPDEAIKVLTDGSAHPVDAGMIKTGSIETGGKLFLAMAEIGYVARIVELVAGMRGGRFGSVYRLWGDLLYVAAGFAALFDLPVHRFTVTANQSKPITNIGAAVFANTKTYAKDWSLTPGASIDDGRLNFMLRKRCDPIATIRTLLAAMRRKAMPQIATYGQAKKVLIESEHPLALQVDGDPMPPAKRLEITIIPNYLRIMAPQIPVASGHSK